MQDEARRDGGERGGEQCGAPCSGVTIAAAMTVAAIRLGVLTRSSEPEPPGLAGFSAIETGRIAQRLSVCEITSALTASAVSRVATWS